MKYKTILIITCITLISVCTFSLPAYARHLNYGWPESSPFFIFWNGYSEIPVKYQMYNGPTMYLLNEGLSSWNERKANIRFNFKSASNNNIIVHSYSWNAYGEITIAVSGSNIVQYDIRINTRRISEDATNYNNFFQSVLVHELGHTIWLADNPNTFSSSIMKYSRDRNWFINPSTYDRDSVKIKYTGND